MKIQKYNESVDSYDIYTKAKRFKELASKHFFNDLIEFDKILIEDGEQGDYYFHIRFKSIDEKSFDKLKIFYKHMGYPTSDIRIEWQIYNDVVYLEEYFSLLPNDIEKRLEELEELETQKKYNL